MKRINTKKFALASIAALGSASVWLACNFIGSLKPPKIEVTQHRLSSNQGFINPITIEQLEVDSVGVDGRPVRYQIKQLTTCGIRQKESAPSKALASIPLNKEGQFSWSVIEEVAIPILHHDGLGKRSRTDGRSDVIWATKSDRTSVCPLQLNKGSWYFINILDPRLAGVYVYVENDGEVKTYPTYTGVSPI